MKGRTKSMVLTSNLSPGVRVYSRALETEKSQSLPLGGRGGGEKPWLQMTGA